MWRASLLSTILPFALAACTTTSSPPPANMARAVRPDVAQRYAAPTNEKYVVDAVDTTEMDPKNLRQVVDYPTTQQSGTIVVDPHTRFLYLVMENGQGLALRCRRGKGRAGVQRHRDRTGQESMAALDADVGHDPTRTCSLSAMGQRHGGAEQRIRSALARFIFSRMARIRCTASMAPPSQGVSERLYHPAAFAC